MIPRHFTDTSVFVGHWPFRHLSHNQPESLEAYLRARGVVQAWVSPINAVLYPDPSLANEPFLAETASNSFFVPLPIVNPTLPAWEADAHAWLGCQVRGLKVTPNYHSYSLTDRVGDELAAFALANDLMIAIQIRILDERAHHPLMKVPGVSAADVAAFALRHPGLRILACGSYLSELKTLSAASNVWVELSFVEHAFTLRTAAERHSWSRLVFGSHAPLFYFEAAAMKLNVEDEAIGNDLLTAVAAENARNLLLPSAHQRVG